jgi:hypothetical protein
VAPFPFFRPTMVEGYPAVITDNTTTRVGDNFSAGSCVLDFAVNNHIVLSAQNTGTVGKLACPFTERIAGYMIETIKKANS